MASKLIEAMKQADKEPHENGGRVFLKDEAYKAVKELILEEVFPEQSFLSERSLAERLGMSKTPVRSAIERLESEGLVNVSPQQGIIVKSLSIKEINEHFDVRIALESFAVRRLSGGVSKEQHQTFLNLIKEEEQSLQLGDIRKNSELDHAFHSLLMAYSANQEMLRIMERQHDMLHRAIRKFYQHADGLKRIEQGVLEHQRLITLMLEGEASRASKLIEKHIEFVKRLLLLSS
ncbi:MAG: GntR family transcriptional regulator [Deinococcales bacterium]